MPPYPLTFNKKQLRCYLTDLPVPRKVAESYPFLSDITNLK